MKKSLLFFLAMLVGLSLSFQANAQERTVSGKVTSSEDGTGLPGVTVLIKGTTNGTITNADGEFKLSISNEEAVLVFSFVGFETQEVAVGARSTIDIAMDLDVTQLSEVLVTAQGIERTKNELAYAAQQVDGSEIVKTRQSNFVNSLSGKVAGVDIKQNNMLGGSTNIVIRGNKSITGNNQALFVIDGVPVDNSNNNNAGSRSQTTGRGGYDYGNAAADINPDDIESVNVLKGAAATALYGSRAANGVVMITTKKGKATNGIGVTINSGLTYGTVDKSTFPRYQNQYGAGYGLYYEDPTGYFLYRDINGDGTDDLVTPTSEDASYGAPFDPNLLVYQWDAFDESSPNFGKARPWVAAENGPYTFFEHPYATNHSVMVDGQTDKGYFKLGYTRSVEKGMLPNSEVDKDYVNFGASYKLSERLTANASINMTKVDGLGRYGSGYDDKNMMTSFRQWFQTNVDIKEMKDAYFRNHENVTWNWTDPTDLTAIYWDNPYFTRYEAYENDSRVRYIGYFGLNYKITDWFDVMGRVSLDSYNELQEERQPVTSTTTSSFRRFDNTHREYNYDFLANFHKNLGESVTLRGLLGTNIRKSENNSIFSTTNGGLVLPRLYSLGNSVNAINAPGETQNELKVVGLFANVTLGFKNMVYLDLAGRRDESSSLPTDNNAYYYPSISGSFVFSELIGPSKLLTGGKIRANYAEVGNTAPVQALNDYYTSNNLFGSVPLYSIPGTKNNSELKPERTKSFEAGMEMTFLDGRAGFDVSYYKSNTVDQIIPLAVSRATGYNSKYLNAGDVENRGVELTLLGSPIKSNNFSWDIFVNWTKNKNKVVSLPEGLDNVQLGRFQGGVSLNAALGEPYGAIRGQDFVYDASGNKVVASTGYYAVSTTSNVVIGDPNPDWLMGINNSFSFKGIALSFLIDIRHGGDIFSLDQYYGQATGLYPESVQLNDNGVVVRVPNADGGGWIFPGVKADGTPNDIRVRGEYYGTFGYRRNPAAGFVYDGSYVKLREVTLTYSLPQSIVSSLGPIKGIDLSLVGRNLWIISKNMKYSDPEDGISSGNLANGYQGGSYPSVKTMGFNVRVKF